MFSVTLDAVVLCVKQIIDCYDEYKITVPSVSKVEKENINKYFILNAKYIRDRVSKLKDMVKKPDVDKGPLNRAILGRYIIAT